MHEIVWTLGAEVSQQELYADLEERSLGRGERLLRAVIHDLELLKDFPFLGPKVTGRIRRRVILGGRIGIFYIVDGNRVILHLIVDLRESPTVLARKLRSILKT